ncbi:MAG TPA: flagellar basal body protein, partial [Nocardioides sp.]|nr:flagellar basal body protein [Nocardioides sp.]
MLHTAINGLAERQNVISDDIANVDTPGFRARSVDFETALKAAI